MLRSSSARVGRLLIALVIVLLGAAGPGGASTATTADILVRIVPDAPTGEVRTQSGYTISITNTTGGALTFERIRFLLPGHGGNALDEETYGDPRHSRDDSPAFDYIGGSSSGLTTADPVASDRWLTWEGGAVAASATATLHFNVVLSDAPAYYWSGATVESSSATVQGTAKGGQIQVVSSSKFAMTMEAPATVALGDTITYTGTLFNGTNATLTVNRVKVGGVRHGRYIPGTTSGALTTEPQEKFNGYLWVELVNIAPRSEVQFTFAVSADVAGVHGIQARAYLTEALPDGQTVAGTGPTAKVRVVE